ncbi:MAG TPA: hypothetical protein VMF13_04850 [Luteitalea sp.]|nr:hypothetical protein [Luteitalea sp.]
MLAELERGAADRAARARLAPVLRAGPWCWPSRDHPSYDLATAIAGTNSAPPMTPAAIPAVTVEDRCGYAWVLHLADGPSAVELGRETLRSWDAASLALPRSVPLLWRTVDAAHARVPRVLAVGTHLAGAGQAVPCRIVQGPSFGLAFFLLQASRAFGAPLPPDLIATAAIREDGVLEPVGGLDVKLATIRALLPGVRRVLVAATQASDPVDAGGLEIVPVRSASQALDLVYGESLADLLLQAGADPQKRQELAEWFFRFSLVGRAELVDWAPVASAAARARSGWPLTADQAFQIAFAQAVAERHEFNAGVLPVPDEAWLQARPAPLRLQVLAHLVQQCADTGAPDFAELAPRVATMRVPRLIDAQPMGWRLEGALARYQAVTGQPRAAMETQAALARLYVEALSPADASFPLAEWLRLSGVLGDRHAFANADALRESLVPLGAFGLAGSAYVDLARSRAALRLGIEPRDAFLARLHGLATDPTMASHVRWSAARAWIGATSDETSAMTTALAAAASTPDHRRRHAAAVNAALVALDTALATDQGDAAAVAVAGLETLEAGILRHLAQACGDRPWPAFVALHYPY